MAYQGRTGIAAQQREAGGTQAATQLYAAVLHLKDRNGPVRLEDLIDYTSAHLLGQPGAEQEGGLLRALRQHERVEYDPRTDLYSWRPLHRITTTADLYRIVKTEGEKGGIKVSLLKESCPTVEQHIRTLEQDGKIIVTRGESKEFGKEGPMRMVFPDEIGQKILIDPDFRKLWEEIKTPGELDLPSEMREAGLMAAKKASILDPIDRTTAQNKKSKRGARVKITNKHLKSLGIDLSKDYAPSPSKS
ncbi:uncharacterized protein L969DRAFT_608927 [Mixia osmundae IAM 14324]|uniref:TFIIE beta domain-containing protein n=1 Tax=Mixia osmundae (strain CBS 9802 / IAM 14324 / JCM 22182 / KY 12970) TaxID=764103 RepID=G7DT87_MIXOS|nr:uncharacterized protein L969DRAFT_608927 [Mixia osmundae IAM 14324]KEI42928.1 hypothetical protein L969DRAFT_608927 [Mixia osmundae IAM 14324]GAA93734.1 hypothetical protein E5Q_00380 [Mixia osmundae IAM 14324]